MAQFLHRDGGTVRRVRAGARRYHLQADRRFRAGRGFSNARRRDYADVHALYARPQGGSIGIVEDKVIQHEAIAALCPTSVNTIRVATLLGDKRKASSTPISASATAR